MLSASAADLRSGHSVAAGSRERDRRCIYEDAVRLAEQRHGLHRARRILYKSDRKQMELLQDVGEDDDHVRLGR